MLDRRQFTLAAAATLTATSPDGARADGRVTSGDVSIFYRQFGRPGKTPLVLMHGANYFDSFDWINVGEKLATDREVVLIAKTRADSVDAAIARIKALHSYTVPCIVALPIITGNQAYLDWVAAETRR